MAGIDMILGETNHGLIELYNFIRGVAFQEVANYTTDQCYCHPEYKYPERSAAYKYMNNWSLPHRDLYSPTSQFILSEILRRWENAPSFVEQCWWEAQKPFCTRLSIIEDEKEEQTIQEEMPKPIKEILVYNGETLTFVGSGYKRRVFVSKDGKYVIKVPQNFLGYEENREEAKIYSENKNGNYASCELLPDGYLKMEYVKPEYFMNVDKEDIPEWVYSIAEAQVGYNLKGELVAYDYGSKI